MNVGFNVKNSAHTRLSEIVNVLVSLPSGLWLLLQSCILRKLQLLWARCSQRCSEGCKSEKVSPALRLIHCL